MPAWKDAVIEAIRRHVANTRSTRFIRKAFLDAELAAITTASATTGLTPAQTVGRELQELRDRGLVAFLDRGIYEWRGEMPRMAPVALSKGVLVMTAAQRRRDRPETNYQFSSDWHAAAIGIVGQWVVYQEAAHSGARGYFAVAEVEGIEPDRNKKGSYLARIKSGSYLEFGCPVPFRVDGQIVERGLLDTEGLLDVDRAAHPVRAISDADYNLIVDLGIVSEGDLLPRLDEDQPTFGAVEEERAGWDAPFDRASMLVKRKVRDRQFRKRVLDVYGERCALTGMKLINGGGRAETQAAHIKSVEAGGPDAIRNGIALSGTIHWMFDRGLISLSDAGDILLSRAINDVDGVERLLNSDRKARFPKHAAFRPDPRYLHWHRTERFHA